MKAYSISSIRLTDSSIKIIFIQIKQTERRTDSNYKSFICIKSKTNGYQATPNNAKDARKKEYCDYV